MPARGDNGDTVLAIHFEVGGNLLLIHTSIIKPALCEHTTYTVCIVKHFKESYKCLKKLFLKYAL